MTTIYIRDKANLPARRNADFYPTERNLIRAAYAEFPHPGPVSAILDIGAGDGRWGSLAKALWPDAALAGVDKRDLPRPPAFDWWETADYLTWHPPGNESYDLIVSNPPYYIAEPIIRRAWSQLNDNGMIIMLLRLSFQAGVNRAAGLWQEISPVAVGVCSRRPSFYGGGTNGTDYGVYVWHKGPGGTCWGQPGRWKTRLIEYEREVR